MKTFNSYTSEFKKRSVIRLISTCVLLCIMSSFHIYAIDYLCFTAEETDASVALKKIGSPIYHMTLMVSSDSTHWKDYTMGDNILLREVGDKVYFKAKEFKNLSDSYSDYWSNYHYFDIPKKVSASGNIMSLLDSTCHRNDVPKGAFYNIFQWCVGLTTAPAMPVTKLAENCYSYMFDGCTHLIKAPVLPAMALSKGCYLGMFRGCESLTECPVLPAIILADNCYYKMFEGCANLVDAPDLPAKELTEFCYAGMFGECTSLKRTPELPAMKLAQGCYRSMFSGCISLTDAPKLPATNLDISCYENMFRGCTNLTSAPNLPAKTLIQNCYKQMFIGCVGLKEIPSLSVKRLAEGCYDDMFNGCTGLSEMPILPKFTIKEKDCDKQFFKTPVILVDGFDIEGRGQCLDSLNMDDILNVEIIKDTNITKYFYPRLGGIIRITTQSKKYLLSFIQKMKDEQDNYKIYNKRKKGDIHIR